MQICRSAAGIVWLVAISLTLLPGCLCYLDIPQNKRVPSVAVTEIHRIIPPGNETDADAQNHWISLKVEDVEFWDDNLMWDFVYFLSTGSQELSESRDAVKNGTNVTVTFQIPLPNITQAILIAKNGSSTENYLGIWNDQFVLNDTMARVTVVGSDSRDTGFLRVTTGQFDNLTVDGSLQCTQDKSPCYFEQNELSTYIPTIERCVDLDTHYNKTLKHCDETYTVFKALPEDPELFLLDRNKLDLSYSTAAASVEVLLIDPTDNDQILNTNDVECAASVQNSCSLSVDIPEGKTNIKIIVVFNNENQYVLGSQTYPFEIFDVSWTQLADDAFMTEWLPATVKNFTVEVININSPDSPFYTFHLKCGGMGTPDEVICETFFVKLSLPTDANTLTVQSSEDQHTVAVSVVAGDSMPSTRVTRIFKSSETVSLDVNTTYASPASGRLIEVSIASGSKSVISNEECTGNIVEMQDGYAFECTQAGIIYEGEKNLIFIAYNDSSDIQEVGLVYTTLKAIDVMLDCVGDASLNASALWITGVSSDVVIEGTPCKLGSPCFILDYPSTSASVPVCTEIANSASGEVIDQCIDSTPVIKEGMPISKFQLKDKSDVIVTAPYTVGTSKVNVVLYDEAHTTWVMECTPSALSYTSDKTCSSSPSPPLPAEQVALLKALIVSEAATGDVITSTAVLVEDLTFTFSKQYPDSLTVEWTATNPEGYTTTLWQTSPTLRVDSVRAVTAQEPTDIVCQQKSCLAFYYDLDSTSSYSLSVHKIGESVSETVKTIKGSDIVDQTTLADLTIVKVTKINGKTTRINLSSNSNLFYAMDVSVAMNSAEQIVQFTSEATIDSKEQISFSHDIPIFDGSKELSFLLHYFDDNGAPSKKGRANLLIAYFDAKLAWVSPSTPSPRSLRVDAGSQEEVFIGTQKCLQVNSPCYFIEDPSLPSIVERCETIINNFDNTDVSQCDSEITEYNELKDISVSLSGSTVMVTAPLDDPEAVFEVTIYDPTNTSSIFSEGNATCDASTDGATWDCSQKLRTPSDRRSVRVLVVEIGPDEDVLKSAIRDISIPSTGVESWVIAVSVLASVLGAGIIVYILVVVVKRSKSKKIVRKEVQALSGVPLKPSGGNRKRSISLEELEDPDMQAPVRDRNLPPVPRKPSRRDSSFGGPGPVPYSSPYGQGQSNPAFMSDNRFGDAPVALPRLPTRVLPGPGRGGPSGYY